MLFPNAVVSVAVVLLALVTESNAFWRMGCRSRTGLVRLDPLVSPGQLSEHMHAIHGSSGFSETATYEELMAGECTSCEVAEDKSAYWHPALYFKDTTTGKFSLVPQIGGMLAYYLLITNAGNTTLTSFPAGFQMIAGDTNQRNFTYPVPDIEKSAWNQEPYNTQAFLRQAALGFNCLNYAIAPEGALYRHFLPDKAYLDQHCTNGVRFELMFPSCWNGKKEIPLNRMDHMAYPSQVMTGECPKGFPERLPSLFYETIWDTYSFKDREGQFVLANGDPTGYGYHGDFIMGWDEEFLRKAVNTCTNLSGLTSDCPLFTMQDPSVYGSCNLKPLPSIAAFEEEKESDLDQLPGNLAITPGPAYANGETAESPDDSGKLKESPGEKSEELLEDVPEKKLEDVPEEELEDVPEEELEDNVEEKPEETPEDKPEEKLEETPEDRPEEVPVIPTLSYSAGVPLASSDEYFPGGILQVNESPIMPSSSITLAPQVNVEATLSDTRSYFSTNYQTLGQEVVKVVWIEEIVTATVTSTVMLTPQLSKRSHLMYHRRHIDHRH